MAGRVFRCFGSCWDQGTGEDPTQPLSLTLSSPRLLNLLTVMMHSPLWDPSNEHGATWATLRVCMLQCLSFVLSFPSARVCSFLSLPFPSFFINFFLSRMYRSLCLCLHLPFCFFAFCYLLLFFSCFASSSFLVFRLLVSFLLPWCP